MIALAMLAATFCLASPQDAPPAAQAPVAKALGLATFRFPFTWNTAIPLAGAEVDGLRVNSIYFNKRAPKVWPLKGTDFGTRARVEVTNTAATPRNPGFAVAIYDREDRLVGVATGGTKIGTVAPGATESFELGFHQVLERIPKGERFHLSVELTD
jgi:hypothetical protein